MRRRNKISFIPVNHEKLSGIRLEFLVLYADLQEEDFLLNSNVFGQPEHLRNVLDYNEEKSGVSPDKLILFIFNHQDFVCWIELNINITLNFFDPR